MIALTCTTRIGGRYSLTLTAGDATRNEVHAWPNWAPRVPNDLSAAEVEEVHRAARDFAGRLSAQLQREYVLHISIPSSLQRARNQQPATTERNAT